MFGPLTACAANKRALRYKCDYGHETDVTERERTSWRVCCKTHVAILVMAFIPIPMSPRGPDWSTGGATQLPTSGDAAVSQTGQAHTHTHTHTHTLSLSLSERERETHTHTHIPTTSMTRWVQTPLIRLENG